MALRRKGSVVEPNEVDEDIADYEEEYEDEEYEEPDEDEVLGWLKYVDDELIPAIKTGILDLALRHIAYECRERYKQLHPEMFLGEAVRPSVEAADLLSNDDILGRDGIVFPVREHGVGDDGKMPVGSFRLNGNAYSKSMLEGRKFAIRGAYDVKSRRKAKAIPAGTIFMVTTAGDRIFDAKVVDPEMQLGPHGFTAAEVYAVSEAAYSFRYDFHRYLFEDGGKNS